MTKTPTGGVVLDPFAGSGTTLLAARAEGRPSIGIEQSPEYVAIIHKRLGAAPANTAMRTHTATVRREARNGSATPLFDDLAEQTA